MFRKVLLFLLLTVFADIAAHANLCDLVLRGAAVIPKDKTESEVLASFNPMALRPEQIKAFPDNPSIFRAYDVEGRAYLLRVEVRGDQNISLEKFASEFIRRLPNTLTPQIRILSVQHSNHLLNLITENNPDGMRRLQSNLPENPRLSVALLYPGESGVESLSRWFVYDPVRDYLTDLSFRARKVRLVDEAVKSQLRRAWKQLGPENERRLITDLKALYPHTAPIAGHKYQEYFVDAISTINKAPLSQLTHLTLIRIPTHIRTQLSDYWALYTILGIPDFHVGNWLLRGKDVIAVDLAYHAPQTSTRLETPLTLVDQQHPFGRTAATREVIHFLRLNISPQMKAYLSTVSRTDVERLARETGYPLISGELDAIMTRINAVARIGTNRERAP